MSRITFRAPVLALALASALALALFAPAAQADAAFGGMSTVVTPSTATVGQTVTVTGSLGTPAVADPGGVYSLLVGGTVVKQSPADSGQSTIAFTYAPTVPGTNTVTVSFTPTGTAQAYAADAALLVSPAPTVTTVSVPSSARAGTSVTLAATVSSIGSVLPTGSVTFTIGGVNAGTSALANSKASVSYTIPAGAAQQLPVTAVYSGDPGHVSSTGTDTVQVSAGVGLSISTPGTGTVGAPQTLLAQLTPSASAGSVTFTVNGTQVGSPVAVNNGLASVIWTPSAPGTATIKAVYSGTATVPAATATDLVNVTAPALQDSISATFNGAPWSSPALGNGATAGVVFSSLSGAPVQAVPAGPCLLAGASLKATAGSGTCSLTVSSPGAGGYAATSTVFAVTIVPGPPTASWTKGRSLRRGSFLRLGWSPVLASSGQPVSFKVTSGPCKISYASSAGPRLTSKYAGSCKVRASAKSVPGQFKAYSLTRTFTVR